MVNFFEQQRKSKLRSRYIVLTFFVFLVLIFVGNYFLYTKVIDQFFYSKDKVVRSDLSNLKDYNTLLNSEDYNLEELENNTELRGLVASVILVLFFIICFYFKNLRMLYKPHSLPIGMGAKRVQPDSLNLEEKTYYNVVSEMSLASGVAVPKIFLLTQEPSINAFTTGRDFQTADITITQGALKNFTREELQAVVAHEFGHIVSEDVKASTKLIAVAFSFSVIFSMGRLVLRSMNRSSRSNSKSDGRGQIAVVGIALLALGALGLFMSRVFTGIFSREREYLADALSVQYTRYPAALASALAKIRDYKKENLLKDEKAEEVSSICFSTPVKSLVSLFDTHPPIKKRITRVDSSFLKVGSSFTKIKDDANTNTKNNLNSSESTSADEAVTNDNKKLGKDFKKTFEYMLSMGLLTESNKEHAKKTFELLEGEKLLYFLNAEKIEILIYVFLISHIEEIKQIQFDYLSEQLDEDSQKEFKSLYGIFNKFNEFKSLSVLDLMVPLLSDVNTFKKDKILKNMKILIKSDGVAETFEVLLYYFIKKHLVGLDSSSKKPTDDELCFLINSLSRIDNDDDRAPFKEAVKNMFKKTHESLITSHNKEDNKKKASGKYSDLAVGSDIVKIRRILSKLINLNAKTKSLFVESLLIAITFDQKITHREFETFRVLCDFLGIPAPPIKIK